MLKSFRPRARLLLQLGDKLIKSENIALLELIKNAYDADSKECRITLKRIDDSDLGEILIEDSGVWMTTGVIENVWLQPWADFKDLILRKNAEQLDFDFNETKRPPIGEKWVGRFGAHKLGNVIEMVTKSNLSNLEVVVTIDWRSFEEKKYLDDVKFDVETREPLIFTNGKTGTRIHITWLKKAWDKEMFVGFARAVNGLNSPFYWKNDEFKIYLELDLQDNKKADAWSTWALDIDTILEKSLWRVEAEISGDTITKFDYEFRPYETMDKIASRKFDISALGKNESNGKKMQGGLDLEKYKIWTVKFIAYVFDLSWKILKLGSQEPKPLKEYLEQNGWVRVYRDWLRIYDYGEQWNDWLELDRNRINAPSKSIGNKNILAAVELKREDSLDLIEKTNREWFTENGAYTELKAAVEQVIELFTQERNIDKSRIRDFYWSAAKGEPVNAEIDALEEIIIEKFEEDNWWVANKKELKSSLLESLKRIRHQYQETNEILLKSAGAGLSLSVVLHELEKRIKALHSWLKSNELKDLGIIKHAVDGILGMIEGYSRIITSSSRIELWTNTLIDRALLSSEFRFQAHEIEIERNYSKKEEVKIQCIENMTIGGLLNLFDNSIYWLWKHKPRDRKILVTTRIYDKTVGIIVADNWDWFSLDPEVAVKPFITKKLGGMWLWLYIADEMMRSVSWSLIIRNFQEVEDVIPSEYANGAIVELLFPIA